MKRIVIDTGPIIHLHEADSLLLLASAGSVILSPLILQEIRSVAGIWMNGLPHWARLETPSEVARKRSGKWVQAGLLHGGEAEALAVAEEVRPDWFLTDDAAARLLAQSMGIECHGSLGIVLWSVAKGIISKGEAETRLTALENSSLWLSPRVRAEARASLAKM